MDATGCVLMTDLSALLDSAALPERTVEVCLRGDLQAEVEELSRELQQARATTLADRGEMRKLAEQIEKTREAMLDSTVVFRLRGLNRAAYSSLMVGHPPRDGNDGDATVGYNADAFFPALIRACMVEPDLTDEQWDRLVEVLSSGQFDALADAALAVCRRKVDVPFSFAASATLLASDETSK